MKKRGIATVVMFIAGAVYCFSGVASAAWQTDSLTVSGGELPSVSNGEVTDVSGGEERGESPAENLQEDTPGLYGPDTVSGGDTERISLVLPRHLEVIIDPWGMDGKGQIYSRQYVIQNTGKTAGTLHLWGLSCTPGEQSGAVVRMNPNWGEDSQEKYVYLEMIFGNGDEVVFSQEGSNYETRLEPGEEMTFWFSGKVNENSFQEWMGGDVEVNAVYSWTVDTAASKEECIGEEM